MIKTGQISSRYHEEINLVKISSVDNTNIRISAYKNSPIRSGKFVVILAFGIL